MYSGYRKVSPTLPIMDGARPRARKQGASTTKIEKPGILVIIEIAPPEAASYTFAGR
jgi:hypothetical protein